MPLSPTLVCFRLDLRLTDHAALTAAVARGGPVIPVFIWAPEEEGKWAPGAASRWWLHHSLAALAQGLEALGSRLLILTGPTLGTLRELVRTTGAGAVYWSRRYEPSVIARDAEVKAALRADGVDVESFNATLLHEPWTVQNLSKKPFQVFTPFWKHCLAKAPPTPPLPAPVALLAPTAWPQTLPLEHLKLQPTIPWAGGLESAWKIGSTAAHQRAQDFAAEAWPTYSEARNRPDQTGTSRLSPHLHFGEISPCELWWTLQQRAAHVGMVAWEKSQYVAEIGWREFAYHLLFHFPNTPESPLREEWALFPCQADTAGLTAWCRGRTGFPIVDAGLRELWTTGWMHNRVRMIVASFLIKDLLLPWQEGAQWFWDTLVDADLAANTLGWQWTAGCGADAAPFFRIFNPISQGVKFDPLGKYVHRWVPELRHLPAPVVHEPWISHPGGVPGYPAPIVDHAAARVRALAAYATTRG